MTNVLLTGAGRGIGAATLNLLKDRGANVIGHASTARGDLLGADFADPASVPLLWQEALKRAGGQIDVLINNAGAFEGNPIEATGEIWLEGWRRGLEINLNAAATLSRLFILHAQEGALKGRLVHVASRAGHRGDSPAHWHYAAAKGGLLAMHKTIARAYAAQGIMSFAITPGFTDTSESGDYLESRGGAALLADIPLGRVATPDEIAKIAVFCALDAPESMTGATLDANGASYVR